MLLQKEKKNIWGWKCRVVYHINFMFYATLKNLVSKLCYWVCWRIISSFWKNNSWCSLSFQFIAERGLTTMQRVIFRGNWIRSLKTFTISTLRWYRSFAINWYSNYQKLRFKVTRWKEFPNFLDAQFTLEKLCLVRSLSGNTFCIKWVRCCLMNKNW